MAEIAPISSIGTPLAGAFPWMLWLIPEMRPGGITGGWALCPEGEPAKGQTLVFFDKPGFAELWVSSCDN